MTEPTDRAAALEALWQQGDRPDLEAFVAAAGTVSPRQLADLVAVDRRERWRAGERVPAEDYFRRFPTLHADPGLALDVLCGELMLDEECGRTADEAETARRFPDLAASLRVQLELQRALTPTKPAGAAPLPRQFGRHESTARSAAAGWGPCTSPGTCSSAAGSPSRCRTWPTTRAGSSSARPGPRPPSDTRASAPSTTSAKSTADTS